MQKNKHHSIEEMYNQIQQTPKEQLSEFFKKEIKTFRKRAKTEVDNIDTKSDLIMIQEKMEDLMIQEEMEEEQDFSNKLSKVGTHSTDYKFYNIDPELYEELYTRTQEILEKAEEDFMGFRTEPIISKNELLKTIFMRSERINTLINLGTPSDLMEDEFECFEKTLESFINKEYGDNSCKNYCKLVKEYRSKSSEWFKSEKFKTLCNQLIQYNTLAFEQRERELLSIT